MGHRSRSALASSPPLSRSALALDPTSRVKIRARFALEKPVETLLFNLLSPNIHVQVLLTVLLIFLMVSLGRI